MRAAFAAARVIRNSGKDGADNDQTEVERRMAC